ncbi:unnamed protein product [Ranitomeya imitator]|uniref:EF-hand domain-containing protein n=1 Tax=Ranitomeya imitator TaxID=111125 RepID=A0ABN9LD32_9NEOB|nr:unnamed protein product [Ranitomeya imitator]
MAVVESAVYNLLGVFHKYSAKEGDNLTLNRSELATLLESELPCCYRIPEAFINSLPGSLLKTPIMGKTSDLTDVKKAIIDTLKQEGKTQKEISQQIGCSQSAVSRHLNGKSVGRKQCGRKRCTTRRGDRTLRKIVEKDRFQTLGNLRKQWTESGVETSRATVHRRVQEMGYRCRIPQVKPLLNHKQLQRCLTWATEKQHWTVAKWSQVLFSDESKFCMSFGNQGARVWRKTGEKEMPKCLKSSVKYPQSVMVWGAMSAAGVGPLCFIKGRVNAASYQEILEHFMLPSAEMLYGDEDFIFQHDLAPAHSAKTTGLIPFSDDAMRMLDLDGDGEVDFMEFIEFITEVTTELQNMYIQNVLKYKR